MSIQFKVKLKFSFRFSYFKFKLDNSKLFPKLRLPHGTSERGAAGQIIIDFIISNALASWPPPLISQKDITAPQGRGGGGPGMFINLYESQQNSTKFIPVVWRIFIQINW